MRLNKYFILLYLLLSSFLWAKAPINYEKDVTSALIEEGSRLKVEILTPHLKLTPISMSYLKEVYTHLYKNLKVMETYSFQPADEATLKQRIENWEGRWQMGDPINSFVILQKETGKFLGQLTLTYSEDPGLIKLSYLIREEEWGKGYASEAVGAILKSYLPKLQMLGIEVNGKPLNKVFARSMKKNTASWKILEKFGFHLTREGTEKGQLIKYYELNLK